MKFDVTLSGVSALAASIDRINQKVKEAEEEQMMRSALRISATAKELAPVDTGRLRSSINVRRTDAGAEVFSNVVYAPYVEFGTSRNPAQPYVQPAVEQERKTYPSSLAAGIRVVLHER